MEADEQFLQAVAFRNRSSAKPTAASLGSRRDSVRPRAQCFDVQAVSPVFDDAVGGIEYHIALGPPGNRPRAVHHEQRSDQLLQYARSRKDTIRVPKERGIAEQAATEKEQRLQLIRSFILR